jgi:hypothetical protein
MLWLIYQMHLIENHNELNRNLIKNFWFQFFGEKYFNYGFKEIYLKTMRIEIHNEVNRNLIKNFWIRI